MILITTKNKLKKNFHSGCLELLVLKMARSMNLKNLTLSFNKKFAPISLFKCLGKFLLSFLKIKDRKILPLAAREALNPRHEIESIDFHETFFSSERRLLSQWLTEAA